MHISACSSTYLGREHARQARQLIVLRVPVARTMLEEPLCADFRLCVLKRATTESAATKATSTRCTLDSIQASPLHELFLMLLEQ